MSEQETVTHGVVIRDQPVHDLSHLTSPEQLAAVSGIHDVALVVVPESLAGAYAAIPVSDVASTIYVPANAKRYWLSLARKALAAALGRYDETAEES